MKKNNIFARIKDLIVLLFQKTKFITIPLFIFIVVFYMQGTPINIKTIYIKISTREIDIFNDLLYFWWDFAVYISFMLNLAFAAFWLWFKDGLENGTIRVGGTAAND